MRRYSPRTRELYEEILTEFQNNGEQLTPTGIRNYEIHLLDEKKESARHPTPYASSNVRRSRNGCRSFTGRTP